MSICTDTALGRVEHRPLVLLDCDGVLADFVHATIQGTRQQLAAMGLVEVAKRLPDAANRWDIKGCLVDAAPEHVDDIRVAVNATWRRAGLAASLPVYPGAVEGVTALREVADVVALTAPMSSNPTWCSEREDWLRRHFGFAGTSTDIIITGAKWRVPGDMLVEDKPEAIRQWREKWPGIGVLVDRPHNQDENIEWRVTMPEGWGGILEMARAVARRQHPTEETRRG